MVKRKIEIAHALAPCPAVLVSCRGRDGKNNIITIGWIGVACSDPPMLSIAIRPQRHSYGLIRESGEFVVNVPREDQLSVVDYCGMVSGRNVDKFEAARLTPLPAEHVGAPLIEECPINMECRVVRVLELGVHHLFIGELLAIHVDEELVRNGGKIDFSSIKPPAYFPGSREYWSTSEMLASYGFTKGRKEAL